MKEYPVEHPLMDLDKKTVVLQDNISTIKLVKDFLWVKDKEYTNPIFLCS